MADTYTLISSVTVGAGGASSIDFTSIPATYTDLKLVYSARSSTGTNWYGGIPFSLNGTSTSTSSSQRGLYGTGSAAASENYTNTDFVFINGNGTTGSTFSNGEIYIPNYAGSNNKSISADMVTENNASTALAYLDAALWSNTSAINRITITPASGTIVQYSNFYLYGIKNS